MAFDVYELRLQHVIVKFSLSRNANVLADEFTDICLINFLTYFMKSHYFSRSCRAPASLVSPRLSRVVSGPGLPTLR